MKAVKFIQKWMKCPHYSDPVCSECTLRKEHPEGYQAALVRNWVEDAPKPAWSSCHTAITAAAVQFQKALEGDYS